ncbi:DUF397 domain-containing protein [Sphaerisporangium aureirubrum]|uniref:DUF397 domain-containing protein n=1 Tax=Sphaerisporangium aureirubrum TaxID=1544736 RepID=A0ABW1NEM6_9ACTN
MDRIQSSELTWRKSRYSGTDDNCVEVAALSAGGRAVRDSKNTSGPMLFISYGEWRTFTGSIKDATFE